MARRYSEYFPRARVQVCITVTANADEFRFDQVEHRCVVFIRKMFVCSYHQSCRCVDVAVNIPVLHRFHSKRALLISFFFRTFFLLKKQSEQSAKQNAPEQTRFQNVIIRASSFNKKKKTKLGNIARRTVYVPYSPTAFSHYRHSPAYDTISLITVRNVGIIAFRRKYRIPGNLPYGNRSNFENREETGLCRRYNVEYSADGYRR